MGVGKLFTCDGPNCKKTGVSNWNGPPDGWVRLGEDVEVRWDGNNWHILHRKNSSAHEMEFCSFKCLSDYMVKNR